MEKLEDIRFVEMKDSQYLQPYRMHYKQAGQEKLWDCIHSHNSVYVLIFNKTRKVFVFVEQFRPSVFVSSVCQAKNKDVFVGSSWQESDGKPGITIELCAGIIDKDMSKEETAAAEVFEECGYTIKPECLEKIVSCLSSVGSCGDQATIFYCEVTDTLKVSEGGGLAAEGELINVKEMSIPEARAYVSSPSPNTTSELLFAVTWFLANKTQHIS